jgi:MerR HTH family regulatory protein
VAEALPVIAPAGRIRHYCACGNPVTGRSAAARWCLECAARLTDCPHCGVKAACEGLPACSKHLEAEIGITYRQLDYWARQGYLKPGRRANRRGRAATSGVFRVWPAAEVEIARRMGRLARAGLDVARAAVYARDRWPCGEIAPGFTLEVSDRG